MERKPIVPCLLPLKLVQVVGGHPEQYYTVDTSQVWCTRLQTEDLP